VRKGKNGIVLNTRSYKKKKRVLKRRANPGRKKFEIAEFLVGGGRNRLKERKKGKGFRSAGKKKGKTNLNY